MQQIQPQELLELKTVITNFMLENTSNNKTYSELVMIFERDYMKMKKDPSNDLRILKFSKDMKNGNWEGSIVISIKNDIVVDGVHRGIAYLRCIKEQTDSSILPQIFKITI